MLKLKLKSGVVVSGPGEGDGAVDALKDCFNRDGVIEGRAVYRPVGALLRVDVQAIGMATAANDYIRVQPSGRVQGDALRSARLSPGEGSVCVRMLGQIPTEKSNEDFLSAVTMSWRRDGWCWSLSVGQ